MNKYLKLYNNFDKANTKPERSETLLQKMLIAKLLQDYFEQKNYNKNLGDDNEENLIDIIQEIHLTHERKLTDVTRVVVEIMKGYKTCYNFIEDYHENYATVMLLILARF